MLALDARRVDVTSILNPVVSKWGLGRMGKWPALPCLDQALLSKTRKHSVLESAREWGGRYGDNGRAGELQGFEI